MRRLERAVAPLFDRGHAVARIGAATAVSLLVAGALPSQAHAAPPSDTAEESVQAPPTPEGLVAPVLLAPVTFVYPAELAQRSAPPSGRVTIRFVVGVDGVPKEASVTESVDPELDSAVQAAVMSLRYSPATYQGTPVEVVLSVSVDASPPPPPEPDPKPDSEIDGPDGQDQTGGGTTGETETGEDEPATGPVRISGTLKEAGSRVPVGGAIVLAIDAGDLPVGQIKKRIYENPEEPAWTVRAITDADGKFELRGVPDGKIRLIFVSQGYDRLEWVLELKAGKALNVTYFQERLSTNPFKTTVATSREQIPEITQRSISAEEIRTVPGTQGDALKSLQNFPGVARAPFGAGLLIVRGAAPSDSATFLAAHEIPLLFHFGGLTSVFNSDILEQIDFVPGNFDSRYGDAIGGVVNVVPRKGRTDGFHGYVDSDLFDTGVMAEGRIGKKGGSFIVSARRSYIDFILPRVIPEDAGLNFTLAPRYSDYQVLFDHPIKRGEFTARAFGSSDKLRLILSSPNESGTDSRNSVTNTTYFHRQDLAYRHRVDGWDFLITPSFLHSGFGFAAVDQFKFDLKFNTISTRAEAFHQMTKRSAIRIGTEFVATQFNIALRAPTQPDAGSADTGTLSTTSNGWLVLPAIYATGTIKLAETFTIFPGLRTTMYNAPLATATIDPRLRVAWDAFANTTIKAAVGIYSQSPEPRELDATFGNPKLSPERSLHSSIGFTQGLPRDWSVDVTAFHKHVWDLTVASPDLVTGPDGLPRPELFRSTGRGRIYGAELLVRKPLTSNFYAWLGYTIMRSEIQPGRGEPYILFDFDQTHILTLIASYKLPHNWQIGGRFRVVSGNPTTPLIGGALDANTGIYTCFSGRVNSDRLPAFHQLDLRVDKNWIFKRLKAGLYLDVLNAYNSRNTEFLNYDYRCVESVPVTGLPIIPSIGTRIEW